MVRMCEIVTSGDGGGGSGGRGGGDGGGGDGDDDNDIGGDGGGTDVKARTPNSFGKSLHKNPLQTPLL